MRFKGARRPALVAVGLVPVLLIALLKIVDLPGLAQVSYLVFDSYQRAAPRAWRDAGVRVVDIDDETIRRHGQWPWPRTDVADLTRTIADAGAAAIAFDIVFSEADRTAPRALAARAARQGANPRQVSALLSLPDEDAAFAGRLAATPSVLGFFLTQDRRPVHVEPKAGFAVAGSGAGTSVTDFSGAILPLAPFRSAAQGLGFVSIRGDRDGVIRRAALIARAHGVLTPALSLEALRVAQGAGAIIVRSSDASGDLGVGSPEAIGLKVGDFEVPITERGEMWMHYTLPVPERVVPAWRILSGTMPPAELKRLFEGRIVFIGAGAIGLRDLVSTPVQDRELGVIVHAQAAEQIVLQDFLYRPDWVKGMEVSVILACGLLLAVLLPSLGALGGAMMAGGMIAAIGAGSWYAFRYQDLLVDPAAPAMAVLATYVFVTLLTYVREERQRAYIHGAFDRYLSPELVRRIALDPGRLELGGEERQMTVLFCDIRGFSHISEQFTPQEIIAFMVAFLTPMTEILLAHRATIDKFMGDAILAFWNAPLDDADQYRNAAAAALEMRRRLARLNEEMAAQDRVPWPEAVEIGIGLNAGPCCVGNMGSQQRLSYSLIGDTVNLASRLEGLTKQYGVGIAIGAELAEKIPGHAMIELDRVRVIGRHAPATVYALLGDEALAGSPDFVAFAGGHAQMMEACRAGRWQEAESLLEAQAGAAQALELGRLYALYARRIRRYLTDPALPAWDGVISAEIK